MKIVEKRNKKGLVEEFAVYDHTGNPLLNDFGFARKTLAYDANGNVTEERFYGLAGESVLSKVCRCARIARSYWKTDNGRVVEERYYGLSGEPVPDAFGVASRVWTYDSHDRNIEQAFFGLDGQPVLHKTCGCARIITEYETAGDSFYRFTEERYLGLAGEPVIHDHKGCAVIKRSIDESQGIEEECFYGVNGERVLHKVDGCAIIRRSLSGPHRYKEERYYGLAGEPVLNLRYQCARITWEREGEKILWRHHKTLESVGETVDASRRAELWRMRLREIRGNQMIESVPVESW